ncbi:MAG TPA: hypothetical protein VIV40_01155 [Kofleriaceae bacterium]
MSARSDVLLWANRVIARKGQPPHVLLEISEQSTPEEVQAAFHKIARSSHPDLHRHGLSPDEHEIVTTAYAAIAGAYAQMRSMTMHTVRMKPLKPDELAKPPSEPPPPRSATPPGGARTSVATPPAGARTVASTPPAGARTVASTPPGGARSKAATPPAGARTVQRAGTEPSPRASASADSGIGPPTAPPVAAGSGNVAQAMSAKALLYYRKAELCLKRGDLTGAILQLKLACAADPTSAFLRSALAEVETEVRKA